MRIIRNNAIQVHAVPDKVVSPQGPFPPHLRGHGQRRASLDEYGADFESFEDLYEYSDLAAQPEIVYPQPAYSEDGSDFAPGATVQNNFKPIKYLRCIQCSARVAEADTASHVCEE